MTSPVQITKAQVPQYQYLTPAIPEMIALGINSPIVIAEQLIINDRLHPDRYFVKTITGLRGSDVRDTRVPHPSAHGEIPYDSFMGGKTITVDGTMEAGNIAQLNRMESDLMAVLGPLPAAALGNYYSQSIAVEYLTALQALPEFPVRFNWWDQHDGFYDPLSVAFWSQLSGASLVIPGVGRATTTSGGSTLSYHNLRGGFVDEVVTAMVSVTPVGGANQIGVISACTAANSYLYAVLACNSGYSFSLQLQAVLPSGTQTLGVAVLTVPSQQSTWWVQLQTVDDDCVASVYDVDPRANPSAIPTASVSATLLGATAEALGYGVAGFVGVTASSTANWCYLDWRVGSLYPCDFQIGARLIQSPAMGHTKQSMNTSRYMRDFQFSIRASDPRILCPTTITKTIPLQSTPSVALGRSYPKTYPFVYTTTPLSEPTGAIIAETPTQGSEVDCVNRGSWIARPIITIYGGVTNPTITNLSTGKSILLNGTIASGDYVAIDCLQFLLTNSVGANVFGLWDPTSDWITLQPGDNIFTLVGQGLDLAARATVRFSSAWI